MPNTADVLVVGLGAVGSAAVYQAAKLGARVIGIDRFAPPHDHGSSHGDSRITRQAIGEGDEFVPLVLRSNQIWEELQSLTGRTLLNRNGCLVIASPNTPGNHHGSTSFLDDTIASARRFAIAHEILNNQELQIRFPQFRLRGDEVGYLEPAAGYLRPEACVETQLSLARRFGAQIFTSQTVVGLHVLPGGTVKVRTSDETYSAANVVLSAGAWLRMLLDANDARYLTIYRQVMFWFALASSPELFAPDRLPVFIWIAGNQPRDMLYGFPAIDGPLGGVKIAAEQYESSTEPDTVEREVNSVEIATMYSEYIALRFPDVSDTCLRAQTCLYTVTPDAKFIIDRFRNHENILFASACSGHGFKHSAAVAEALVCQLLGQPGPVDLSSFSLERFRRSSFPG